jgi:hypothetical protein
MAMLNGCTQNGVGFSEPSGEIAAVLTTGSLLYVATVLGTVPPNARTGDLARNSGPGSPSIGTPISTPVVIAQQCATPGDGGGGTFWWDPSGGIDDGGTVIVPTVDGNAIPGTTSGPCWRRDFSGALNVRWFGAQGDGGPYGSPAGTNDAPAIQIALAAALGGPARLPGGLAESNPTVYFPHSTTRNGGTFNKGVYYVGTTLQVEPGVLLLGDSYTILATDQDIAILNIGMSYIEIRNIQFVGGKHAISLFGAGVSASPEGGNRPCFITHCGFFHQSEPSIWQDTSIPSRNRSFQQPLTVSNFDFVGAHLYWGVGEHVTFSNGHLGWDQLNGYKPSGDGLPLGCFNSSGELHINNCRGTMGGGLAPRSALVVGNGDVTLSECSFGQVGNIVLVRSRTSANTYYGTNRALSIDGGTRMRLTISDSSLPISEAANWLEIYQDFVVDSMNMTHFSGGMPRQIVLRNMDLTGFANSLGIWLDPGVNLVQPASGTVAPPALGMHKFLQTIRLEGFRQVRSFRIRQGGDPSSDADPSATDLTGFFAAYLDEEPEPHEPVLQPNLFLPGIVDGQQIAGGGGTFDQYDQSTGYSLSKWRDLMSFGFRCPAWGAGMPPGVYVFSVYWKGNFAATFLLGYHLNAEGNQTFVASRKVDALDVYQRISFAFYLPAGSTLQFTGSINFVPPGASGSIGLPCVNKGRVPAPYQFPGNAMLGATGFIPCTYYGASTTGPTSGSESYKMGDIWIVHPPQAGQTRTLVCVAGGSPGTWKVETTLAS